MEQTSPIKAHSNMGGIITAHIANLAKYNSGVLTDAELTFPTTKETVQAALKRIGVDGLRYAEIIITDYETSIPGLLFRLGEFAHLDELNYLAHRLHDLTPEEREKFAAAAQHGEYGNSPADLINLTYNLDCYELFPEVHDYEAYGLMLVEDFCAIDLPDKAKNYFDYAQYGEDEALNNGGEITQQGYIFNNSTPFTTVYEGQVPQEYRVMYYPMEDKAKGQSHNPRQRKHIPDR